MRKYWTWIGVNSIIGEKVLSEFKQVCRQHTLEFGLDMFIIEDDISIFLEFGTNMSAIKDNIF